MSRFDDKGADYAMTDEEAGALLGATQLPADLRKIVLTRYLEEHGQEKLIDLFAQFMGLATSVVANNREMCELILIEAGMNFMQAEKANLPTIFGALQGVRLANGVNQDKVCHGCAFRLGSCANQSPITTTDAHYCVIEDTDFLCHEDLDDNGKPLHKCRGFGQARKGIKQ